MTAILPIKGYDENQFIVMATSAGTVKKCRLTDFSNQRSNGIIAVNLDDDDHLIGVSLTEAGQDILLVSREGKAVRFSEADARAMGRTARGVRGIRLSSSDQVISLMVVEGAEQDANQENDNQLCVLTSTVHGYGKRTNISDFPRKNRGGKGVIAIKTSERNGGVVSSLIVNNDDEAMLITDGGVLIRTRVAEISVQGRNTQGVRLISLSEEERLVSVERVDETPDDEPEDGEAIASDGPDSSGSPTEEGSSDPEPTVH